MRGVVLGLIAAVALGSGCKREVRDAVDTFEVDADGLSGAGGMLGWSSDDVGQKLSAQLKQEGFATDGKPSAQARVFRARLVLDLEESKDAPEIWMRGLLVLSQRRSDERRELDAEVVQKLEGAGLEERREAVRAGAETLIQKLSHRAKALLGGERLKDEQLVGWLSSDDEAEQLAALELLAQRKNPAVTSKLLERLKSDDLDEVRKAIGRLIEVKDPKAVSPMIDASRGRDPNFQREVIFAVAQIGGDDAEAYLDLMAQGHDEQLLRDWAQQALDEMKAKKEKK